MKTVKTFLSVLMAALIIMPLTAYSQMQNYAAYGNISIMREFTNGYGLKIKPLKAMDYHVVDVITWVHHNTYNPTIDIYSEKTFPLLLQTDTSMFMWTTSHPNDVKIVKIPHCEIRDFDIVDGMIYFCGEDLLTGKQFIAYTSVPSLFDTSVLNINRYDIDFTDGATKLTKIKYYTNADGERKLAIVSNTPIGFSRFIDYTISSIYGNNYYEAYGVTMYVLTDVLKTNNYISLVGKLVGSSPANMVIYRHDKNAIPIYEGRDYNVMTGICDIYLDSGFNATVMDTSIDNIVIGYSIPGYTNFSLMDLNDMSNFHIQYISTLTDTCAKITDMKYDKVNQRLFVLMCDGADKKDRIAEIDVYNPNSIVNVITPVFAYNEYSLSRSLTFYDDNQYYTVVGRYLFGNMCWFDKVNPAYQDARCYTVSQNYLVDAGQMPDPFQSVYDFFYPMQQATPNSLNIIHETRRYEVICERSE